MKRLLIGAVLALSLTAEAHAALISLQMEFMQSATEAGALGVTTTNLFPGVPVAAGRYVFNVTTPDPLYAMPQGPTLYTYCLDIRNDIADFIGNPPGPRWYDGDYINGNVGTYLSRLVAVAGGNPWAVTGSFTVADTQAFQLAVWEVVEELTTVPNSPNFNFKLSNGNFSMSDASTNAAAIKADSWLLGVMSWQGPEPPSSLVSLVPTQGGQSQAILFDQQKFVLTPEPSSLCIWAGLALVGCGLRYRRRKSQA
jgi:hypothetical protein